MPHPGPQSSPEPSPGPGTATSGVPAAEPDPEADFATAAGMRLLAAGVPLTLLYDLVHPLDSAEIAASEGGSASWLPS